MEGPPVQICSLAVLQVVYAAVGAFWHAFKAHEKKQHPSLSIVAGFEASRRLIRSKWEKLPLGYGKKYGKTCC